MSTSVSIYDQQAQCSALGVTFLAGLLERARFPFRTLITGVRRCYLSHSSLIIPHFKDIITGRMRYYLKYNSLIIPHFKDIIIKRIRYNLRRSSLILSLNFKADKRSRGFCVTCAPRYFLPKKISPIT